MPKGLRKDWSLEWTGSQRESQTETQREMRLTGSRKVLPMAPLKEIPTDSKTDSKTDSMTESMMYSLLEHL